MHTFVNVRCGVDALLMPHFPRLTLEIISISCKVRYNLAINTQQSFSKGGAYAQVKEMRSNRCQPG